MILVSYNYIPFVDYGKTYRFNAFIVLQKTEGNAYEFAVERTGGKIIDETYAHTMIFRKYGSSTFNDRPAIEVKYQGVFQSFLRPE